MHLENVQSSKIRLVHETTFQLFTISPFDNLGNINFNNGKANTVDLFLDQERDACYD